MKRNLVGKNVRLIDRVLCVPVRIDYLFDPDEIFKTNVARCSPAQFVVGPHRPDEKENIHAARVYLKPLERLAIFDADTVPRLALDPRPSTFDTILALHPGSGSEKKNWPEEKWADLLQHLINSTHLNLLLVGGEAEGERLRHLAAALPPTRLQLAQSVPLAKLARRLQSCAGFVGHDSGVSHLAAALGLPCLILWADTIEEIWRPQGERLAIVRELGGVRAISVDRVLRELGGLLEIR